MSACFFTGWLKDSGAQAGPNGAMVRRYEGTKVRCDGARVRRRGCEGARCDGVKVRRAKISELEPDFQLAEAPGRTPSVCLTSYATRPSLEDRTTRPMRALVGDTHGCARRLVSMREPKDEHERKALADVENTAGTF